MGKNGTKEVTLPSGATATIRKVTAFNFATIFGEDDDTPQTVRLICGCTLTPEMSPFEPDDERLTEDMPPSLLDVLPSLADQMALAQEIQAYSGMDAAMAAITGIAAGASGNASQAEPTQGGGTST